MKNIYIYKITNKKTNKIYIGIRFCETDAQLDKYKGEDTELKKEFKQYGKKTFIKEVIATNLNENMANLFLEEYRKHLKATVLTIKEQNWMQQGKRSGAKRKVICLNNKKVFDSGADASIYYGFKKTSVPKACQSQDNNYVGVDSETGEKLQWMYYDKYLAENANTEYVPPENHRGVYKKRVLCETTGEEFNSIKEASEFYNVSAGSICSNCKGTGSKTAGIHPETGESLTWCYID